MKNLLAITLLISFSATAQSKKELETAIMDFARKTVMNKSYESYDTLWDAIYIVQQKEYPEITRESKDKGYIEARIEKEAYKERLTIEILGKGPYKISLSFQSEKKDASGWIKNGSISDRYSFKIQSEIYEQVYGPIQYPAELLQKIEAYNSMQSKDKKKLIQGRDF